MEENAINSLFQLIIKQKFKLYLEFQITPTFSSGKMRRMHPVIVECVQRLKDNLNKIAQNKDNNEIELKKMMSNLTMDVISTCAFATKIDIYGESTSEFVIMSQRVLQPSLRAWLSLIMYITFPKIFKWMGIEMGDPKVFSFFRNAVIY